MKRSRFTKIQEIIELVINQKQTLLNQKFSKNPNGGQSAEQSFKSDKMIYPQSSRSQIHRQNEHQQPEDSSNTRFLARLEEELREHQSTLEEEIKAQVEEGVKCFRDEYTNIIQSNLKSIEKWEKTIENNFRTIHARNITQLDTLENTMRLLMDVMNHHESKKLFQHRIKKLVNFKIGKVSKDEERQSGGARSSQASHKVNNSILSSIRKQSIPAPDSDRKHLQRLGMIRDSSEAMLRGINDERDSRARLGYDEDQQLVKNLFNKRRGESYVGDSSIQSRINQMVNRGSNNEEFRSIWKNIGQVITPDEGSENNQLYSNKGRLDRSSTGNGMANINSSSNYLIENLYENEALNKLLSKSGKIKKLAELVEKASLTNSQAPSSRRMRSSGKKRPPHQASNRSSEKKPPTPSKQYYGSNKSSCFNTSEKKRKKRDSTTAGGPMEGVPSCSVDFPDFTLDSPQSYVNLTSGVDENVSHSVDRPMNHIELDDLMDAKSLPISILSLKNESTLME